MAHIRPILNSILVRPLAPDGQHQLYHGLIHLPGVADKGTQKGVVIAVGSGHRRNNSPVVDPLLVKPGDVVVFPPLGLLIRSNFAEWHPVGEDGEKLLLMPEEHVMAVLEPQNS